MCVVSLTCIVLVEVVEDPANRIRSLLALAQGAKDYNLVQPRMTLENTIQIEKGRQVYNYC
jgi:hypothetical protein